MNPYQVKWALIGALGVTVIALVPIFIEKFDLVLKDRKRRKEENLREKKKMKAEDRLTAFEEAMDILAQVEPDDEIDRLMTSLRMSSSKYSRDDSCERAERFYSDLQTLVEALDKAGYEDYSRFLLNASADFDQLQKVGASRP